MAWQEAKRAKVAYCLVYRDSLPMEFVEHTHIPLRVYTHPAFDKMYLGATSYGVVHSRNTIVEQFLTTDCTHLLWVDADIVVESIGRTADGKPNPTTDPNLAIKTLLDFDVPIASGLYRAKQQTGFSFAAWMKVDESNKGFSPLQQWSGNWLEVDVIGLGFCLIKREVFEKMTPPWFHWEMPGEISEDFAMCLRAKSLGFPVRVFTDLRLTHLGSLAVQSDGMVRTRRL